MKLDNLVKKAEDARRVYDYLAKELNIDTRVPVKFLISQKSIKELKKSNLSENPFPHVIALVLAKLRKKGVDKLFKEEKVIQTAVIAAVLSLCAELATNIGELRGDTFDGDEIDTDILYSGMQAIRLYMANYKDKEFKKVRLKSALRVDNAINGYIVKKEDFKSNLLKNVKFIWYESVNEDPIKVFTRLNIGKIPLTSAELVKAMFLRSDGKNRLNREKQEEISLQWDNIEKELHNETTSN